MCVRERLCVCVRASTLITFKEVIITLEFIKCMSWCGGESIALNILIFVSRCC